MWICCAKLWWHERVGKFVSIWNRNQMHVASYFGTFSAVLCEKLTRSKSNRHVWMFMGNFPRISAFYCPSSHFWFAGSNRDFKYSNNKKLKQILDPSWQSIYISIYMWSQGMCNKYIKLSSGQTSFFHHMLNSVFFRLKDFDLIVLRQFLHSPCFGRLLKS